MKNKGSVVQLDRISDFGSEGWGFESSLGHFLLFFFLFFNNLEAQETISFPHSYAKTLENWYHNFLQSWDEIEPLGFDEKFKRTWKMYLAYCRGGFLNDRLFVSQYLLSQK